MIVPARPCPAGRRSLRAAWVRSSEINNATRILVVEVSETAVGLIVDSVDEVLLVPADQIEPMPISDGALGEHIAKVEDRLITLVDAERALGYAL